MKTKMTLALTMMICLCNISCSLGKAQPPLSPETTEDATATTKEATNTTEETQSLVASNTSDIESLQQEIQPDDTNIHLLHANLTQELLRDDHIRADTFLQINKAVDQKFIFNLVKEDNLELLTLLLKLNNVPGLDTIETSTGRTALHYARSEAMAELLWDRNINTGKMQTAPKARHTTIKKPANQIYDMQGNLPIHVMAAEGHDGALLTALEHLCSWSKSSWLNTKNADGQNLAHLIAKGGHIASADLILQCQYVDFNLLDTYERSPLSYALINQDLPMSYILINKISSPIIKKTNSRGENLLGLASEIGDPHLIKMLHQHSKN